MENHSSRWVPFIVAVALGSASCSGSSATFTGSVDARAYGIERAVVIAQSLAGATYVSPVGTDQRFVLGVPAGDVYRFAIARPSAAGYRIVSRVNVETDAGWVRYVEVGETTVIDLGAIREIDWGALRSGAVSSTSQALEGTTVEDPGTGGGTLEDPGACDEGATESAGTRNISQGAVGVHRQVLGGGQPKVTLCHVPPGDPGHAVTLTLGFPALDAHLEHHGDYLGACRPVTPPDPGECPPELENPDAGPGTLENPNAH